MGVEGASFHGFVNDGSLWNLFGCFLCISYYRKSNSPILKILGQFENLGFVIMSTRENIRLIARAPLLLCILEHTQNEIWSGLGKLRKPWSKLSIYLSFYTQAIIYDHFLRWVFFRILKKNNNKKLLADRFSWSWFLSIYFDRSIYLDRSIEIEWDWIRLMIIFVRIQNCKIILRQGWRGS